MCRYVVKPASKLALKGICLAVALKTAIVKNWAYIQFLVAIGFWSEHLLSKGAKNQNNVLPQMMSRKLGFGDDVNAVPWIFRIL